MFGGSEGAVSGTLSLCELDTPAMKRLIKSTADYERAVSDI